MSVKNMESRKAELFSPIHIGRMEVNNRGILPTLILNFPVDAVHEGYWAATTWVDSLD